MFLVEYCLMVIFLFSCYYLNDARPNTCQPGYFNEPYRGCRECRPCARPRHLGDEPDGFVQECFDQGLTCPNFCIQTRLGVTPENEYVEMCRNNFTFNAIHSHTRTTESTCDV